MSLIKTIFQIPIKIFRLFFRLIVAVIWIILGVFGFLISRPVDKSKSKMDNYAKEAWVKSGK